MNVSPHDYNRDERENSGWWSSRHGRGARRSEGLRRSRRITLFDMLLLAIMAGVLVPWFLSMDDGLESGPYRVKLETRDRDELKVLILTVRLPRDAGDTGDTDPVGWIIYREDGEPIHEDWDLPPAPGSEREFIFTAGAEDSLRCEINTGAGKLIIFPGKDGPS